MSYRRAASSPRASAGSRALGTVALVLALGGAAASPFALDARSGHGDGMGDIGPLLLMLLSAPLVVVGALVASAGALSGAARTTGAGAVVTGLGALLTLPVLGFGAASTTLVSLLDLAAAGAATGAVLLPSPSVPPS